MDNWLLFSLALRDAVIQIWMFCSIIASVECYVLIICFEAFMATKSNKASWAGSHIKGFTMFCIFESWFPLNHLMMETEVVPEMSVVLSYLTWLSPRKYYSKYILTTDFCWVYCSQVVTSIFFYCVAFTSCIWENMHKVNQVWRLLNWIEEGR